MSPFASLRSAGRSDRHVHLILIPTRAESLPLALKHAHGRYAAYFNAWNKQELRLRTWFPPGFSLVGFSGRIANRQRRLTARPITRSCTRRSATTA